MNNQCNKLIIMVMQEVGQVRELGWWEQVARAGGGQCGHRRGRGTVQEERDSTQRPLGEAGQAEGVARAKACHRLNVGVPHKSIC